MVLSDPRRAPLAPPDTALAAPLPTDPARAVQVTFGRAVASARLVQATPNVLLLEGELPGGARLPVGTPLRVTRPGQAELLEARLAAHGDRGRYLVALGSRAVRGAARVRVDLPALARGRALGGQHSARVVDLSSSGARVRGVRLPVGSEFELCFVPPGRRAGVRLGCVVVRAVDDVEPPEVGVTFTGGSLSFSVELSQHRMAAR
jgi:hypothetical protein